MATHQQIGGMSDQQLLERMVERYPTRFDTEYWRSLPPMSGAIFLQSPLSRISVAARVCTCPTCRNATEMPGCTASILPRR